MRQKLLIGYCLFFSILSPFVSAKILFHSTRGTTFVQGKDLDFSIYMMDDDGRNVRKLTDTPFYEVTARWSPDGKAIAFARDIDIALTTQMQTELFIMDVAGTYEIRLTDHPEIDGGDLAWSPDGTHIAFVSTRSGDLDIHVIDVASRAVKQLTNNAVLGGLSAAPDWSPDGEHITYEHVEFLGKAGRSIRWMLMVEIRNRSFPQMVFSDTAHGGPQMETLFYLEKLNMRSLMRDRR